MLKEKRILFKNYAYNSIYQILILIVPLFLTPFLSRTIGAEAIGQYSYTRSVVTYFVLFGTIGSNLYAQREIAYTAKDNVKRSKAFWEIFLLRLFLILFVTSFYSLFLMTDTKYSFLFGIQALDLFAAAIDITWYFQGTEHFREITIKNAIIKLITALLIVINVKSPDDLWIYVMLYAAGNLFGQLWMWKGIFRSVYRFPLKQLCPLKHLHGMLQLFIPQIAIQIYLVIDKTMIELLTSDSAQTGYYELAQIFQRTGVTLVTAFGSVAAVRVANLKIQNNIKEICKLLTQSYELVSFLAIPLAFGICAVASNFIPWFLGNDYIKVIPLLIILSPLIIIIGYSNISGMQYLVPAGLQKYMTYSTATGAVINICLNSLMIPLFGALGAAFSSFIAELVVMSIQFILIKDVIDCKRVFFYFAQALLCSCIMCLIIKLTEYKFLSSPSLFNTLILSVEGIIVYIILQFLFKNQILNMLKNHIFKK